MYRKIFATMPPNTIVLTANSRQSRHCAHWYNHWEKEQGKTAWPALCVTPVTAWLDQLWNMLNTEKTSTLTAKEEQVLWQRVLQQNDNFSPLLPVKATAQLAQSAFNTLALWNLTPEALCGNTPEVHQFQQWSSSFQQLLDQYKRITTTQLATKISEKIKAGAIKLEQPIVLLGFDTRAPAIEHLFECMAQHTEVIDIAPEDKGSVIVSTSLPCLEEEITAMARWAKKEADQIATPEMIGCIVPQLHTHRKKIKRIFDQVFQTTSKTAYNLSSGTPLSDIPIIRSALELLRIHAIPCDTDLQSNLLLTPYWIQSNIERAHAAETQTIIWASHPIHMKRLLASTASRFRESQLCQRVTAFYKNQTVRHNTHSNWAEFFHEQLHIIGWPGKKNLSSFEYQAIQQFYNAIDEWCQLDAICDQCSYLQALSHLKQTCDDSLFQTKTESNKVQVLGLLEASGCAFKKVWIMGLNQECWPPKPSPNPFLPLALQKKLHMPHASAEKELQFCKSIMKNITSSTSEAILSYCTTQNALPSLPSGLIKQYPTVDVQSLVEYTDGQPPPAQLIFCLKADNTAPPITSNDITEGGSGILKAQSECPFKAFARYRLKASLQSAEIIGISAQQQGIYTHKLLELLWSNIKSQQTLTQLSDNTLKNMINHFVEAHIQCEHQRLQHFYDAEKNRLKTLLFEWLLLEKQRAPFVVDQKETRHYFQIGPLKISIQIDRIDQLDSGHRLIIDYKTGRNNRVTNWMELRPQDPQLPLYLLSQPTSDGIAYAQVNMTEITFKGIVHHAEPFMDVKSFDTLKAETENWQTQLTVWKNTLEQISVDFVNGRADKDPAKNTTCTYCEFSPLCRKEQRL